MAPLLKRYAPAWLGLLSLVVFLAAPAYSGAQMNGVDEDALEALKGMTEYLGGLEKFSMSVHNMGDEVLASGQKIQQDLFAEVVVQRPNRLRTERRTSLDRQVFFYNGSVLAVYSPDGGHYAATDAPDNLDDMLHFAREELDLVPPAGDLVFSNAFDLLTAPLTSGFVVGKVDLDGVICDHLAFTSPLVDWEIWIADGDQPLPFKFVISTNDDVSRPQDITLISNWNTSPEVDDSMFTLDPPEGASEVPFLRMITEQP